MRSSGFDEIDGGSPFFWADHPELDDCDEDYDHRRSVPFAVRVCASKEIIGFVLATSGCEVMRLIDEVCDPNACEVAVLPRAGGVFLGSGASEEWLIEIEADDCIWLSAVRQCGCAECEKNNSTKLRNAKKEVAALEGILTDLRSKLNARHRSYQAKNGGALGKGGQRENLRIGSASPHWPSANNP